MAHGRSPGSRSNTAKSASTPPADAAMVTMSRRTRSSFTCTCFRAFGWFRWSEVDGFVHLEHLAYLQRQRAQRIGSSSIGMLLAVAMVGNEIAQQRGELFHFENRGPERLFD